MTFYVLGACAVFATFGAVNVAVSAVLGIVWPMAKARLEARPARTRARWLLALRLSPVALGALASASVALPSFLEFEPRDTTEIPGLALTVLASVGLVLALVAAARMIRANAKTRRVLEEWSRTAVPVTLEGVALPVSRIGAALPIVALTGWRRPRLVVSGRVLDGFERRLLLAMAAHETGHRSSADNLWRLLLAAGADPLLACRAGREMIAAWEAAAEEAADDGAVASGTDPADLAEALVSVARLAPPAVWPVLPWAAFYRGAGLDRRVRRLLEMPPLSATSAPPRRLRRALGALLIASALMLAAESLHRPLHRLLERSVATPHPELRALVVGHPRA
jgi:hypothetical protein